MSYTKERKTLRGSPKHPPPPHVVFCILCVALLARICYCLYGEMCCSYSRNQFTCVTYPELTSPFLSTNKACPFLLLLLAVHFTSQLVLPPAQLRQMRTTHLVRWSMYPPRLSGRRPGNHCSTLHRQSLAMRARGMMGSGETHPWPRQIEGAQRAEANINLECDAKGR